MLGFTWVDYGGVYRIALFLAEKCQIISQIRQKIFILDKKCPDLSQKPLFQNFNQPQSFIKS
jgi:hypothetical protein